MCDGNTDSNLEPTCGRTMGLEFNHKTGELYALDARYGPMVVGRNGGLATPLAPGQPGLEGVPHDLPDGLDVDQVTGNVYFTYAGSIFLTGYVILIPSKFSQPLEKNYHSYHLAINQSNSSSLSRKIIRV